MKRIPSLILPCILVACSTLPVASPAMPTESAFESTKLFQLTAEAKTQTSGYPANDATITAIMANKYAGGTAMAATMTAQPSETTIPTIPLDSPPCRPTDLKSSFASNAATQTILLGAGITNTSNTPCFLQARPQVVLVDRQDQPLDVDYHYFEMGPADDTAAVTEQAAEYPTAKIGVWPGWTAWLNLAWSNWCGAPVSGGMELRLTLMDDAGVLTIPTDIQSGGTCNAQGYRSSVGIAKLAPALPPQ